MDDLGKFHLVAIGGFDPGGGAGILRDGLTARALGCTFRLVGTAWAEQSPLHGVQSLDPRPRHELAKAIGLALKDAPLGRTAVKIGMVINAATVGTIATSLASFGGPVVFDPVLGATAGGALFDSEGASLMEALAPLIKRSHVFTPNAQEAALMCDSTVEGIEDAAATARMLAFHGARAVVVKGGHLNTENVCDVLVHEGELTAISSPRSSGPNVRGTGCTYASSLALFLARGEALGKACELAQAHVAEAIRLARRAGNEWHLGHGLPNEAL